jgi:hypothetical protein
MSPSWGEGEKAIFFKDPSTYKEEDKKLLVFG